MKFGLRIAESLYPEWQHYVSAGSVPSDVQLEVELAACSRPPSPFGSRSRPSRSLKADSHSLT